MLLALETLEIIGFAVFLAQTGNEYVQPRQRTLRQGSRGLASRRGSDCGRGRVGGAAGGAGSARQRCAKVADGRRHASGRTSEVDIVDTENVLRRDIDVPGGS